MGATSEPRHDGESVELNPHLERLGRLTAHYALLVRVTRSIARAHNAPSLFEDICRVAVEEERIRLAWVGVVDNASRVAPVACAGPAVGYLDGLVIDVSDSAPKGCGLAASALLTGLPTACVDIATDPRMLPWRNRALALNLRAAITMPFRCEDNRAASFNLYADESGFFDGEMIGMLSALADDLNATLAFFRTEREKNDALVALKLSEGRLRRAEELAHLGYWTRDLTTGEISFSDEYRRMFGIDPQCTNLQLPAVFERILPEDREVFRQGVEELLARTQVCPHDFEYRTRQFDGTIRHVHSRGAAEHDGERRPLRTFGTVLDVTERKQLEAERNSALDESNALLAATRGAIGETNFDKAARAVFDACRELIGAAAGHVAVRLDDNEHDDVVCTEPTGLPFSLTLLHAPRLRELREQAFRTASAVFDNDIGATAHDETAVNDINRAKNVLVAPLMVNQAAVGLIWLTNKPGGFAGRDARLAEAFGEIAAVALRESRARVALARSEERFRLVFHGIADGVALVDVETRKVVMSNKAMWDLVGYTEQELTGLTFSHMHPPEQIMAVGAAFERCAAGAPSPTVDIPVLRKDGSVFYASIQGHVQTFRGRKVVMGCFRDVTDRRALQASLAQSDRLASMGLLAAGVAHEINNPLTYVMFGVQLFLKDLPQLASFMTRLCSALRSDAGDDELRRVLGNVEAIPKPQAIENAIDRLRDAYHGCEQIKEIVRGLSTFSRVEQAVLVPTDLRYSIECAINMAHNEIKYRARLVKDFAELLPPVMASDGRLSQVFLNLLINASHAVDKGSSENNEIRIRTWVEGRDVLTEVSDTGKGIPPEVSHRIFEPFFTTKDVGVGSGLGLAICKNIVTDLGGEISFESEIGKGTTFRIRLQAARSPERDTPTPSQPLVPNVRGRILVIDDDPLVNIALQAMLDRDHDVVAVGSGESACALLDRDQEFDLVLCDLMMPGVSGMDVYEWLARRNPELARRIVFITGGAFTPKARQFAARIENLTIEKPVDPASMRKDVARLIAQHKSGRCTGC